MSYRSPLENDDLDASEEAQLVTLLDEFEKALQRGANPKIESYLERVPDRLKPTLLHDLIRIENELLSRDKRSTPDNYRARFPEAAKWLEAALDTDCDVKIASRPRSTAEGELPNGLNDSQTAPREMQGFPSLTAETAELLRSRLLVLAWIVAIGIGLFLVRALIFPGGQLLLLRTFALAGAVICIWRLSISRTQMIGLWRRLEIVLIVLVALQTVALQVVDMVHYAGLGDSVYTNSSMLFAYMTWSVSVVVYAILIPNHWKRAAVILLPAAAIPLAVALVLRAVSDQVASSVRSDLVYAGALLTFVAAGAALMGTFTVNSLRRQLMVAHRFGPYRLTRRLGKGGMGEVYLAEHELLKRPAAIKLIRPGFDTDAEVVARFEREVQATAELSHWNTVQIFDYGRTDDGTFYYVMEYLEGQSLQDLVERHGPLPPERVIHLMRQICAALDEAHQAGLIHQDIKPANVVAARCGRQTDIVKLLDFGLVHAIANRESDLPNVVSNRIVGTPRFMSPEQSRGEAPDARSDIYSLGATAFYLLTARPVFADRQLNEMFHALQSEKAVMPSRFQGELPGDLVAIVMQCLEKAPAERPADVSVVARELAQCQDAGKWTAGRATEWWQQYEPQTLHDLPKRDSTDG